jgi:colicin import membrane protein
VYGWLLYRRPPRPAPTLAIEATAVDARAVRGVLQAPRPPAPPPPQPEPQEALGPPPPTPEERAQQEQQRQQAQAAAEQKAAEEQAAREAEARREAEEARALAERHAHQQAEAQKRAAEERQRKAEAQEETERQADLKRSLAAEEQAANIARSGPALASWKSQIQAKIQRAWLKPPTARPGIKCVLYVTQVPGGEVTKVTIGECNGDQAVRESIEAAVYRASPLPPPPDPALFDRNLTFNFNPD